MKPCEVVCFHRFGAPGDVLRVERRELPRLADGLVRLRMIAAPVNPADLNFIEGTYGVRPELPAVPGIEGCGEVLESRAGGWRTGERAIVIGRPGTWRSHLDASPTELLRAPASLDPQQAAMLKVNPATAWHLLGCAAGLGAGDWVAHNAANSGVGRCLIQLACRRGLRTINLLRRPELAPELHALGAEVVLPDDEHAVAAALAATAGQRPALACNAVGGDSALRLLDLLDDGGLLVTYGAMSRRSVKVPNSFLIFRRLRLAGFWLTKWLESAPRAELEATYAELAGLAAAGALVQPVDSVFPLAETAAAVARAAAGGRRGKVLLAC
jgi:NADPH:quinone reductase-like Zn-dependent oxidoreductase